MRKAEARNQNSEGYKLQYSLQWSRAKGWALDKDRIRHRIGFVYGYWWHERLGFASDRVYCEKEFIEKNFIPVTPLQELKHRGF